MTQRHRRLRSDASALSFAVIYDPVNGLQSFVEPVLSVYDDSDGPVPPTPRGQAGNIAGFLDLGSLDMAKRPPFSLFSRRGPEKHVLNIRTSSLFEKGNRGQASSPTQSEFSISIYSQESGTDESTETYVPPAPASSSQAPTLVESESLPVPETKATPSLRPKLRFKIPSLYAKVSFYRTKPAPAAKTATPHPSPNTKPDVSSPVSADPEPTNACAKAECSTGPKVYTLFHKVHNATCSGAAPHSGPDSHTGSNSCCDMVDAVPSVTRATHQDQDQDQQESDSVSERWRRLLADSAEQDFACGGKYDHQLWPDFEYEYDPRLPSRFSVTTTSTSRYVEINRLEALSFVDSESGATRCYSAPFDDVPVFAAAPKLASSPSSASTLKRMRNPWRPRF